MSGSGREFTFEQLAGFITARFGARATLTKVSRLGDTSAQGAIKGFGYGKPLLLAFTVDGEPREAVLSSMRGDAYGHQFPWDRGAVLWFQHATSGSLPGHVKSLGLGYVSGGEEVLPLDDPQELVLLQEKAPGYEYADDLKRMLASGVAADDPAFARRLAGYLAGIHAAKRDEPSLYVRRVRELVGSGECIMGLMDEAFPPGFWDEHGLDPAELEQQLIGWRWRLKGYSHRLAQVHGDFHPWNILRHGDGFTVLDRSRGEWGEPAGDVAALAINYLLFGLLAAGDGSLPAPFLQLYRAFVDEYLAHTGDEELAHVSGPFWAFRALVVASPVWYPNHPPAVRRALLRLLARAVEAGPFDLANPQAHLEG